MTWKVTPTNLLPDDADAVAYIAAVEAADGEALEPAVKLAYNSFVKGCKADGTWPAIKASCILAGARTLNGALVPLVGAAPTNYNFVTGDYNRKTGLVGDGSTKYLDSNRTDNADPTNNRHFSYYVSSDNLLDGTIMFYMGGSTSGGNTARTGVNGLRLVRVGSDIETSVGSGEALGYQGFSRFNASNFVARISGSSTTYSAASTSPGATSIVVFARSTPAAYSVARLAFYSIGESLDLALLDTRVTALVNTLGTAIP